MSGPVETRDPNSLESLRLQPDEIYDNNAPGITYHELTQEKYINRFESIRGTVADNEIHTNIVESSCNTTLIDESNNLDWFYQGYDVIVEQPVEYDIFNDDSLCFDRLFEQE